MDDLALKFLAIGLAMVLLFFVLIGIIFCFYQRRKKQRQIHLEKVIITNGAFDSPQFPYKTKGIFDDNNMMKLSEADGKTQPQKNGFSQVFRGSPKLPRKTFEAPPPPQKTASPTPTNSIQAHSPRSHVSQTTTSNEHMRSVVVIDNYSDDNKNTSTDSDVTQLSPKSFNSEKLSLKNRPFKLGSLEKSASLPKDSIELYESGQTDAKYRENMLKDLQNDGPTTTRKFPSKMEKLQENENEMLFYEFEILNQEAMTSIKPRTTSAEMNENIRKNRFYDILPYDFNRVKLKITDRSDFINASYVNADDGTLKYIAAQGPIGEPEARDGRRVNTVNDFWLMVWQEQVDTIVMLTECTEGIRSKCAMYWPDSAGESINVGNGLSVHLYCITEDDICFQRELLLEKEGQPKRKIIQWHYKEWQDSAGAEDAENLLTFMESVRAMEKKSPILIHCSAGVGRTGVYIALDMLLDKLVRENVIDVFETVSRLRESRTSMVQSGEQYLTVYEVIALAIRRRSRSSG